MTSQTQQNPIRPSQLSSRRKSGMLEYAQFALLVFGIFLGGSYIARALLAG